MRKLVIKIWNRTLLLLGKIDVDYVVISKRPISLKLKAKQVTFVGSENFYKWAIMKCPCGCGDILSLSLMKTYSPNWIAKIDSKDRVTLSPSVWKNDGCCSHFFIKKGKIIWAID